MTKPRAVYYSILNYEPENLGLLRRHFDVVVLNDPREDTPQVLEVAEVLFAPFGFPVDRARMQACPQLRAIVSNTTGIPHIDAAAASDRRIKICALHDEQPFLEQITPTAEHTIGLLMAAHRRIPAAHASAAQGHWSRWSWGAPAMLSRMRLGIVGYGRLGKRVARIAQALDMVVGYYDPYVAGGYPSLAALARNSDVLSLHAPANAQTHGLVSGEVLRQLPRGALVINTARGELLDTHALLECLADGHIRAAALDTIEGEFDPGFAERFANTDVATYARTHDNLILTPHIGGSTRDAWAQTQERVIRKAMRVFDLEAAA
jgi:D-3-phosphoglycerate dehydrogenase